MKEPLDNLAKHKKLKQDLLEEIKLRNAQPHDLFMSEFEIAERWKITRSTIRQALLNLVEEGHLYRINGKGTFISPKARVLQILIVAVQNTNTLRLGRYAVAEFLGGVNTFMSEHDGEFLWHSIHPNDFVKRAQDIHYVYRKLAGIVFFSDIQPLIDTQNRMLELDIPCLYYGSDRNLPVAPTFSTLTYSQTEAVSAALDHLYELGHRNIGIVYNLQQKTREQRFFEYRRWMQEKNLTIPENSQLNIEFLWQYSARPKYEMFRQMCEKVLPDSKATAFFCVDDMVANYFINATLRAGFKVPQDFSVIGISNYPFCDDLVVPLSTVEIPFAQDARLSLDMFIKNIEAKAAPFHKKTNISLIKRESTDIPRGELS